MQAAQHVTDQASPPTYWWEQRWFLAFVVALSAVPLLYPDVPPLVDLFGHMGRYRVQLDIGHSPWLRDYYGFDWAAIGNLGVDLLVMPLGRLLGLELAIKLIVLSIPPMTVAGFLWVAKEVHGRVPPTALFALPFALSYPFLFGFVNYALSIGLAFLAFGLWLTLGRQERLKLRAFLFVPISVVVFFAHTYGWGVLGLLCFSAEAVRQHDKGIGWFRAGVNAAVQASVMALPLLIMIAWRSEAHGGTTGDWFNWKLKWMWVYSALRDRWYWFDIASLIVPALMFAFALVSRRLTLSRNLAFSALVLAAAYVLLPRIIFGSAYADMRLAPYVMAVGLLAIRFRSETPARMAQVIAVLGLGFYLVRIAATTASLAISADSQEAKLAALDHLPMGAKVVTLVGDPCGFNWPLPRDSHLGAMVIVRRHGFSNDQWVMEGLNLLELRYGPAGDFAADPSQRVRRQGCSAGPLRSINDALRTVPRRAFDYVWLINPPPFDPELTADMEPVWRGPGSTLYRFRK